MRSNATSQRSAFSLVEMMAAMTVLSILAVGVGGTLVIASRAVDDGTALNAQIPEARDAADLIMSDISDAITITERTATAITITVPDRDDDGTDEIIRYAWDGIAGGVLTRQYNSRDATTVAEDVHGFDLTYLTRTVKPPPQACCYIDGTCVDEPPDDCNSNGGLANGKNTVCETTDCIGACCVENGSCVDTTELRCTSNTENRYRGDGSRCADSTCPNALKVLFVTNGAAASQSESDMAGLIESWGFVTTTIEDAASQGDFDTAVTEHEVVYIAEAVSQSDLGTKLKDAAIGIVFAERDLHDEFGASENSGEYNDSQIEITDNTHDITQSFDTGVLTVASTSAKIAYFQAELAPGAASLAIEPGDSDRVTLLVLDKGDTLYGGGVAAGRRIALPIGAFASTDLNDDGARLLKRSLQWGAAESDGRTLSVCGDSSCDRGEDPCTCPGDCGSPTLNEQASFNCADGIDNDCDGSTDCDDADCAGDAGCMGVCGDSTCDMGEDSCNCAADCGAPTVSESGDTACADDLDNDCDGQTDCDDTECSGATPCAPSCGDGNCDPGENACDCSADCGAAPVAEADCEDGEDNDCDSQVDCDDSDCDDDPACGGSCLCGGAYRDDFESGDFWGSTGKFDWSTAPWIEVGESDGASSGDVMITSDIGSARLRLRNNDNGGEGVMRAVNVCPGGTVTLSLQYRRSGLNNANEYVKVEVSSTGSSGPWTELTRFQGKMTDASYQLFSTNISAHAGETTWIRFLTSTTMNDADVVYLDDVSVTCNP